MKLKKYNFLFSQDKNDPINLDTQRQLIELNCQTRVNLIKCKNMITEHNRDNEWDKYKKYANEYELVFTSSSGSPNIASYGSISRSFFKLWEILHDFKGELDSIFSQSQLKCAFIAEGPGGFVEAFAKYRKEVNHIVSSDMLHGITLISPNKNVPNWKLPSQFNNTFNIRYHYGVDGTGNIYNLSNIESFVNEVGKNSCEFVTADGGFDFSNDFNEQEESSFKLIVAETLCAFKVLKRGGCFILKIFDIYNECTLCLIQTIRESFENLYITKPFTSRPANSEKYIVAIGFLGHNTSNLRNIESLFIESCGLANFSRPRDKYVLRKKFIQEIIEYNKVYTCRQILSICRTIVFYHILRDQEREERDVFLRQNLHIQLEKGIRWCFQYNIQTSKKSLIYYKKQLMS